MKIESFVFPQCFALYLFTKLRAHIRIKKKKMFIVQHIYGFLNHFNGKNAIINAHNVRWQIKIFAAFQLGDMINLMRRTHPQCDMHSIYNVQCTCTYIVHLQFIQLYILHAELMHLIQQGATDFVEAFQKMSTRKTNEDNI